MNCLFVLAVLNSPNQVQGTCRRISIVFAWHHIETRTWRDFPQFWDIILRLGSNKISNANNITCSLTCSFSISFSMHRLHQSRYLTQTFSGSNRNREERLLGIDGCGSEVGLGSKGQRAFHHKSKLRSLPNDEYGWGTVLLLHRRSPWGEWWQHHPCSNWQVW